MTPVNHKCHHHIFFSLLFYFFLNIMKYWVWKVYCFYYFIELIGRGHCILTVTLHFPIFKAMWTYRSFEKSTLSSDWRLLALFTLSITRYIGLEFRIGEKIKKQQQQQETMLSNKKRITLLYQWLQILKN